MPTFESPNHRPRWATLQSMGALYAEKSNLIKFVDVYLPVIRADPIRINRVQSGADIDPVENRDDQYPCSYLA